MKTNFEHDFTSDVKIHFEHSIEVNGMTYLVIFGTHVNGGFICIPNHNWGCEASDYANSAGYNAGKLIEAGATKEVAKAIAEYIDNWNSKREPLLDTATLSK